MSYTAIIDTREKIPWEFCSSEIREIIVTKLDTGDYSVAGLEDKLCIERKRSISELVKNITEARFKDELERMSEYKYRYLILEFNVDKVLGYPVGSGIPQIKWKELRVKGPYIMNCISRIQVKYGVHVVFAENPTTAAYFASNIMKLVHEIEND